MPESERHLIRIAGRCYPIETFDAAFHTVFLERLEAVIPKGATERAVCRAIRNLRSAQVFRSVFREALRRVMETEPVPDDSGVVVSLSRLDKPDVSPYHTRSQERTKTHADDLRSGPTDG